MELRNLGVVLVCILANGLAGAGAWDVGAFDNDDALDWVWEVTESSDLTVVAIALDGVSPESDYIEAPTGSYALAAAEMVAALNGKPSAQLPAELAEWVATHDYEASPQLKARALRAIALVQDIDRSELAQLWSESDELASEWRAELERLKERLK